MTEKKCPKCGSQNFQVVDYYVTGYIYEVANGIVTAEGTDDGGNHVRTNCVCRKCGHIWHPKNLDKNFAIDH